MKFIPSQELSRMLYEEEVAPLIHDIYPNLEYAAASYGMCSECLGLDDEVSMDHMWGPRITLVLSEEDHDRVADRMMAAIRKFMPRTFKGLPMTWKNTDADIQDTSEEALYSIWTTTLSGALGFCGGADALPLKDVEWLKVSEQHLLEFTNGTVFRDDTGELTRAREALAYYPGDVLRWLLMCGWNTVGGDWFPIGRIGSRGDRLGLRIQAAKEAQHLMRLGFMVSREYTTYKKWFGTLFKRLPIADELEPVLADLLREEDWRRVEQRIWDASAVILRYQNELGIAPEIPIAVEKADDGRHHLACDYWAIGRKTAGKIPPRIQALQQNEVFWLHNKQQILWNEEHGKWIFFLQKDSA
jgi:hypothetical protein